MCEPNDVKIFFVKAVEGTKIKGYISGAVMLENMMPKHEVYYEVLNILMEDEILISRRCNAS